MSGRGPRLLALCAMGVALAGGCADDGCPGGELGPPDRAPAYAVVTSDFLSSAVALLDDDGQTITEAWLDSGTVAPRLSLALSGDVVLPTGQVDPGALTTIDRLGTDTITLIALADGSVLTQMRTTLPSAPGMTAYRPNPQDAVALPDGTVLVSRLEPNLDPAAPELDRGDDLVRLDPVMNRLVSRVDLSALHTTMDGTTILARPERMVRAGPRVVVGLRGLSLDFRAAGPGQVALVDPERGTATAVPLPGLANCGTVCAALDDPSTAMVLCEGATFEDEAGRRTQAGIAEVRVAADGTASVGALLRFADRPELPPATSGLFSLGGGVVVAVARGDERDRLLRIDLRGGEIEVLHEAGAPLVLGDGTWDATRRVLLVPDAEVLAVRRIALDGGLDPIGTELIDVSPCRRLPPRAIRPL